MNQDGQGQEELIPPRWVSDEGVVFELVPGTRYVLCTRDPDSGVWAMGHSLDECLQQYEAMVHRRGFRR